MPARRPPDKQTLEVLSFGPTAVSTFHSLLNPILYFLLDLTR